MSTKNRSGATCRKSFFPAGRVGHTEFTRCTQRRRWRSSDPHFGHFAFLRFLAPVPPPVNFGARRPQTGQYSFERLILLKRSMVARSAQSKASDVMGIVGSLSCSPAYAGGMEFRDAPMGCRGTGGHEDIDTSTAFVLE